MKFIKLFEHFRGSLFPNQFSPPNHIPHLKERFLKELDLSDFNDIIYEIKDEFNMDFIQSGSNNYYYFYWDKEYNRIIIYFVFLSEFYKENKNNIHDHLEEFEDRLSDFEFNSGVTTAIGQIIVHKWTKDDFPIMNKRLNFSTNFSSNSKYIACFYFIEARFKV